MPTTFAIDDSSSTFWSSRASDSPVLFIVGFDDSITLSKVFVTFQTSLPYQRATLQLYNGIEWVDVQYYATNCTESFGMAANAP